MRYPRVRRLADRVKLGFETPLVNPGTMQEHARAQ
jgi:hypothetical protein